MKKHLWFVVRSAVSIAVLWYLFSKTEFSAVFESMGSASAFWLFMSFLLLGIGKLLTGYRWKVLLTAQGVDVPLRTLIASLFVGQFFNSFLPTNVGGDAVRALDLAQYSKQGAKSLTSVVADRFIGVVALVAFGVGALLIALGIGQDVTVFVWPIIISVLLCILAAVIIFNSFLSNLTEQLLNRVGMKKISSKIRKMHESFQMLRGRRTLLVTFLISLALQANVITHYYFISLSLHSDISLLYYCLIIPIVLIVLLLPISINGIGLREGIFVFLLSGLGMTSPDAIALSWIAFAMAFSQGIIGGIIFALRGTSVWSRLMRPEVTRERVDDAGKIA